MKKYIFSLVLFISISLCGCGNRIDEQQIEEGTGIIGNITDRQEETPNMIESDLATAGESWEDAYISIIYDIDSNLADPYNYNLKSNGNVYLGIHDFNNDDIPELIIGDSVSAAVFTYENGNAVKITDLYEPEDWGGINGLYYKDNHIVLVNNGSWGSGYVCFTYDEGEYVIGVYDDYNPDKGVINGNQVTGEVFRQQFNLAELTNNSRIEYSKITKENEIILAVNGESTTIDNLDFRLLEWQDNPDNKHTIEGFAFVDGMEKSVCVTLSVERILRGEEAFKILQGYDTNITQPNEKEEYIIVNFNVSYDSGEIEELNMLENRASLEQAGLYFALSNGQSNAYDVTSYLSNSIYDISLTKGQSAQGAAAFLQEKGNTEPLVFVGFEQIVKFNINDPAESSFVGETDVSWYGI